MVRLLLARWVEPPDDPGLNLSTLIQQVLSVIAQHGGANALELHQALCGPGPFFLVDAKRFARLLRAMATADLVNQASDGTLLHGEVGERIVNHYSFYTAFKTPEEWRLVASGRALGTLPVTQPLKEGGLLIFAGRRWRILGIDMQAHVIELAQAAGGKPPKFHGDHALVGDRVRTEMGAVYAEGDVPTWLDPQAAVLLDEGRAAWRRLKLDTRAVVDVGNDSVVLPWLGDRALVTAGLLFGTIGLQSSVERPALVVTACDPEELIAAARQLLEEPASDPVEVARGLKNTELDKWDWVLDDDLEAEAAAARLLDVEGARRVLAAIAATP
jgi:ATP-dependent Lhr-like helicase